MHLHSLAPKTIDLQCDDDKNDIREMKKTSVARKTSSTADVLDSSEGSAGRRIRKNGKRNQIKDDTNKVVELLDSDSEDDDAVEIIEAAAPKRRKNGLS